MVKPKPWIGLIYDFMVAAFVRITRFLRYISEFTRYASLVNEEIRATRNLKHHIYILSGCKTQ